MAASAPGADALCLRSPAPSEPGTAAFDLFRALRFAIPACGAFPFSGAFSLADHAGGAGTTGVPGRLSTGSGSLAPPALAVPSRDTLPLAVPSREADPLAVPSHSIPRLAVRSGEVPPRLPVVWRVPRAVPS